MAEKRFISEDDCCGYYTEIIDNEKELDLSLHNPKKNLTIEELVDLLNNLNDENEQNETIEELQSELRFAKIEKEKLQDNMYITESDLQYYKSKCASLEEGLFRKDREISRLEKENKQKNQLLYEDIDFLKRFIEKRGFKVKLESDKK